MLTHILLIQNLFHITEGFLHAILILLCPFIPFPPAIYLGESYLV